jgi:UDP-N-acetylmuramoyl-tripeptide--D-alanyl-D-alanine ligase
VAAPFGDFVLIDDSYNANPLSLEAALKTLGARPTDGRRIAVLTDMLELGSLAEQHHSQGAELAVRAEADLVFCAGPLMKFLWDALPPTRRGGYAQSAETLVPQLVDAIRSGDVVMVKGSNGSKASVLAQALAGLARQGPSGARS